MTKTPAHPSSCGAIHAAWTVLLWPHSPWLLEHSVDAWVLCHLKKDSFKELSTPDPNYL